MKIKKEDVYHLKYIEIYIYESWKQLNNYLISENILKEVNNSNKINGISISPKKLFL